MNAKLVDKIWTYILYIISAIVVGILVILIGIIFVKGWGFWDPKFLFGAHKVGEAGGGIGVQLFNSFYMLVLSLVITIPLGLGAGIYLAEYAKEGRFLKVIRLCIETMASLPSIVVGLFGLLVFVNLAGWKFSIIGGALSVSILNLPGLTRVSENAIKDVSRKFKEASLGLGATKWQTIVKVLLPAALPQILTGVILAAGRIFGEAAALLYTAGMTSPEMKFNAIITSQRNPFNIFRSAETLTVHIWKLNAESNLPDGALIANRSAAVLITMILIFNVTARVLGKKLYEKYSGSN